MASRPPGERFITLLPVHDLRNVGDFGVQKCVMLKRGECLRVERDAEPDCNNCAYAHRDHALVRSGGFRSRTINDGTALVTESTSMISRKGANYLSRTRLTHYNGGNVIYSEETSAE